MMNPISGTSFFDPAWDIGAAQAKSMARCEVSRPQADKCPEKWRGGVLAAFYSFGPRRSSLYLHGFARLFELL